MRSVVFCALVLLVCVAGSAARGQRPDAPRRGPGAAYIAPADVTAAYENRRGPKGEGSCVWASCAMCGAHAGYWPAEALLRDSRYGPAVGDGAHPARVAEVFRQRGIRAWSIEGRQTIQWIEWALATGRWCGISYGTAHMIAAVGRRPDGRAFAIVDNNYPGEVRWVSRDVFLREHRAYGGGWCVILRTPGPPPWRYVPRQTTGVPP